MARTTAELLAQLQRLVPGYYSSVEALLAGFAAAMALAETGISELAESSTYAGGDLTWLRLHAHGLGIRPGSGEPEETLRARLRRVEDAVTPGAIVAAVDAIIAPDTCELVEWFEGPFLDADDDSGMWLDTSRLSGGPSSFLVLVPYGFEDGEALDVDFYLDSSFVGVGVDSPLVPAVINEVERLRAAGTFWRLVLEN